MEKVRNNDTAQQEEVLIAPAFSEEALALLFAELHADELRYVAAAATSHSSTAGRDKTPSLVSIRIEASNVTSLSTGTPTPAWPDTVRRRASTNAVSTAGPVSAALEDGDG